MKQINYILVNGKSGKNPSCGVHHRFFPHIGHCIVCDAAARWHVTGSKERTAIIGTLVRLRRHSPAAKILGLSELDPSSARVPVCVSPEMNRLRRELSDWP